MSEVSESDLQELQPYGPAEYRAGLERILKSPVLAGIVRDFFQGIELSAFLKMASNLGTVEQFQLKVIAPAIDAMLKHGSGGLTLTGLDHLERGRSYLFISNHRDILWDPALLTQRLCLAEYGTPRICLGDNLLTGQFVIDLIKMNKGVTVKRGLTPRELLRWSHVLSELISRTIHRSEDSVWIAQREGRTKDGDDRTHPGVLKMLTMSGQGSLLERIAALHVLPVAISYEYDPCDIFKARELYLKETGVDYKKMPGEDHKSMMESIRGYKGRIEIGLGRELKAGCEDSLQAQTFENKKEQLGAIASAIDRQVHQLYRLWPSHYVAHDLLAGDARYVEHYTELQRGEFIARVERQLSQLEPELVSEPHRGGVRAKLLGAYAGPVKNAKLA